MTVREDPIYDLKCLDALNRWREGGVPITKAAREKGVSREDIMGAFKRDRPLEFRAFMFKMSVLLWITMVFVSVRDRWHGMFS